MRVIHVTPGLDPRQGGTVTAIMALVRAQLAQGHDVSVVATHGREAPPTEPAEQLRRLGADVHLVGPALGPTRWHWRLGRVLRRAMSGASIVHIHGVWEEIQPRAARRARRLGVPYVITPHGMLDPWSLAQGALKKRLYMRLRIRRALDGAAAIHVTSPVERESVARLNLRTGVIVEPYTIDFSEFQDLPPRGWLRERFPQIGGRKVVLFFGRLHYKKGLELLIPAFAQARRDDAVLVLAGPVDPAYEHQIDDMILAHGLKDRVFKTGMLRGRDRAAALVDADLFALPSYQENFGIAVVEALASSTPVIVSDQVQIHDCVTRGRVGTVVPTEIEPLRAAIARWLDDDALRRDAASRAREFVFNEYDSAHSARRWAAHYERVIATAALPSASASASASGARHGRAADFVCGAPGDPLPGSPGAAGRPDVAAVARHHAG